MSADLPAQPPLPNPESQAYAAQALARSADLSPAVRHLTDIAYGGDAYQRVAVYAPAEPAGAPLPIVLFMHGGGWVNGHKEWMGFLADGICPAPAILANVGYRLAPATRHPAPLMDCIEAAKAVRTMAGELGGDADRIFVGGHSAGGQLAALMALRPDITDPAGLASECVRGCIPVSGMFDLRDFVFDGDLPPTLSGEADIADASPVDWVGQHRCPFFVAWGARDYAPIIASNRKFIAGLRAAGADPIVREYPGLDHYEVNLIGGDPTHDWARTLAVLLQT
jgi:acetyl esterase/lipase